jgi:hypothetical protein
MEMTLQHNLNMATEVGGCKVERLLRRERQSVEWGSACCGQAGVPRKSNCAICNGRFQAKLAGANKNRKYPYSYSYSYPYPYSYSYLGIRIRIRTWTLLLDVCPSVQWPKPTNRDSCEIRHLTIPRAEYLEQSTVPVTRIPNTYEDLCGGSQCPRGFESCWPDW